MNVDLIKQRLAARKLAADQLATDLIMDCERAASRRNSRHANPAQWNGTDWRRYVHAAAHSPAALHLPALYASIGEIETALVHG
jgi:D-tyrosyl-tRNA(Tyr) deacylase